MNDAAQDDVVELLQLDGKEYLRYKPFKVDVGIVRGTYADTAGNISLEDEPADLDGYAVALAANNSGGKENGRASGRGRGTVRGDMGGRRINKKKKQT